MPANMDKQTTVGAGEYNLQIKSLTDSDVGHYACFTREIATRNGAH